MNTSPRVVRGVRQQDAHSGFPGQFGSNHAMQVNASAQYLEFVGKMVMLQVGLNLTSRKSF